MSTPVTGTPKVLLQLEGLVVAIVAIVLYNQLDAGWLMFAVLFLLPDVGLLGYLVDARTGAIAYNAVHTYVVPAALAFSKPWLGPTVWPLALIWIAHIGLDRTLGLGLKFATGFQHTHLGTAPMGRV
jgi:hypothetical protein